MLSRFTVVIAFPGHAGRQWPLLGWRLVARTAHARSPTLRPPSGTRRGRVLERSRCRAPWPPPGRPSRCRRRAPQAARSNSSERAPPPNTCTLGRPSWPHDGRRRLGHRLDRAADDLRPRCVAPESGCRNEFGGHVGGGEESLVGGIDGGHRTDLGGGGQQVVEVRVAPGAATLLDQPPAGDVAQEADAAGCALLVGEAAEPGRLGGVRTVEHPPDEQPRPRRHVGRPVGRSSQHGGGRVVSSDEVDGHVTPLADERSRALDRREQPRRDIDGVEQLAGPVLRCARSSSPVLPALVSSAVISPVRW